MAYPKITPLSNHVLIRRADPVARVGSIIIPDTVQKKADRGTVIAVGRGRRTEGGDLVPCDCAPGDIVMFPPQLGVEIELESAKFTLLTDDAVIGIVGHEDLA